MSDTDLIELRRIGHALLAPGRTLMDLMPEAAALRDMLERRTGFRIDPDKDLAAGQSRLDSGLAISPTLAAMCIRELFRTAAFIRGLGQAIGDALQLDRPARVLYAGCGPYATLALPLMAVYPPEQAVFTLLDIHRDCLDSAAALISSFGLSEAVEAYECTDAARYRIPEGAKPDVIVSETMAVCLHNEPQVMIARNLLAQAPAARLVPRSVRVDAYTLDPGREHLLLPADHAGPIPEPQRDRIPLGKIFELDIENIHAWNGETGARLPAGRVRIPAPMAPRHRPYLLTHIEVYGNIRLQDYDCSLTPPQRLPGDFRGGEELQFHYHLGNNPELRYEVMP